MSFKTRSISRFSSGFKLKALSIALLSAAIVSQVDAASLGRLTVQSSLGQPLRAEIELTSVAPGELSTLAPRLAPAEAYKQAGIELNPTLLSLRFAIEQRPSGAVVRVTSTQPVNEPFVDMLLELGGDSGRLVREYTFLLDPPELRSTRSASVAPIINGQIPAVTPASTPITTSAQTRSAPASGPVARTTSARPAAADRDITQRNTVKPDSAYTVRKGDTLAKIANQYREPGVSLDQMLVALYRANPDAFVDRNMNRLRAGQILTVPQATDAEQIERGEARGVVVAQAADFNAYRNKLATQAATSEARRSEAGRQASSGSITARVQEDAATDSVQDRLQLSRSGAESKGATGAGGVSEEDLIARDKALTEANARVRELERNVSDLQKLLEIKNQDLASRQAQGEPNTASSQAESQEATPELKEATATTDSASASTAATDTVAPAPAKELAPATKPVTKPAQPPAPKPQPGFFEDLSNNPMFLPGAAALLALLAALGIYSSRRRKKPVKSFEDSIIAEPGLKAHSLFGSTGGQNVDTSNSVFNSNFVPQASPLDSNEVDPIAEADVYIAYGRDAQAEEILKEALRSQPERHAIRVKLLEIYSARNDVRSFEVLATELYSMTNGQGEEWKQAAALGLALDPANSLYAFGSAIEKLDDDSTLSSATLSLPEADQPLDESLSHNSDIEIPPLEFSATDENTADAKPHTSPADEKTIDVADLEFDLHGLDDATETKAIEDKSQSLSAEVGLPPDVTAIDLDFLDKVAAPSSSAGVAQLESQEIPASLDVAGVESTTPDVPALNLADLDFAATEKPSDAVKVSPADFDLSGISLELDPSQASASDDLPELKGFEESSFHGSAEMATKLDLALAYQEIGDKEGARELLEEVVKGGSSEQSARASELLGKLD